LRLFRFNTKRTRILMGFIAYCLVLIVNPMGRILGSLKEIGNNLEIQCHPIFNRLHNRIQEEWPLGAIVASGFG